MTRAHIITLCAAAAAAVGLLLASTMAVLDWQSNPGGIFRTADGTRWNIVWQTWISWFLPATLSTLLVSVPLALWAQTRRSIDLGNEESG